MIFVNYLLFIHFLPRIKSYDCPKDYLEKQPLCASCNRMGTSCTKCIDGYLWRNSKCIKCQDGCKTCKYISTSQKLNCTICNDGFYPDTGFEDDAYTTSCISCGENCSKCDENTHECAKCSDGFYLDADKKCQKCDSSCLSCSGSFSSNCLACNTGYYLSKESDGTYCRACTGNCLECENADKCTVCSNGYYSDSLFQCKSCHDTCYNCTGGGEDQCDACKDRYFKQGNLCKSCSTKCDKCENSEEQCTSCRSGFHLEGQICSKCSDHCTNCTTSTNCFSCEDGYFELSNKCNKCTESYHCLTCKYSKNNGEYCTKCLPGYYPTDLSGTKDGVTCQSCNIEGCYSCEKPTECLTCTDGYFKDGLKCSKCQEPCQSCVDSATKCTSCGSGYYISGDNCLKCPTNCLQCKSSDQCTQCSDGYFGSNGHCVKCDESCKTCHGEGNNSCDICAVGFFENDFKQCQKCSNNCDVCTSESNCIDCAPEYYITDGYCSPCAPVCFECTGPTEDDCIDCDPGYYLSRTLKKCFKCHKACSVCGGPNDYNCTECAPGYYMNKDEYIDPVTYLDKCVECEFGCRNCTSLTNCIECKDNYYLENADCFLCDNGCNKCTGPGKCTECLDGFYISNKNNEGFVTCSSCPQNCKKCSIDQSNNLVCQTCLDGFYMSNGECKGCTFPCSTCRSENQCDSCVNGYLFDGISACNSKCSDSCVTCQSVADKCTSCQEGFMLNSSICLACPDGCSTCEFEGGTSSCTSCLDGYFRIDERCYPCDVSCATCYGSKFENCYSCKEGYAIFYRQTEPLITAQCRECSDTLNGGVANCALCSSECPEGLGKCTIQCTRCSTGFYLSNNVCAQCHESCESCNGKTSNDCIKCKEGYFLQNGSCESCDPSCFGCETDPTTCTSCNSHYYLSDGKCLECDNSCTECQDSPKYCTKCPNNKFAYQGECIESCESLGPNFGSNSDNQCHQCGVENCKQFDNKCHCTSCKSGYYFASANSIELCKPCATENCKQCSNDGKTCEVCKEGFKNDEPNKCTPYVPVPNPDTGRIDETINDNEEQKHFIVEKTTIQKTNSKSDGGAIHIVNGGLTCIDNTISECKVETGGGGGIFIYNKYDQKVNEILIKNLVIKSCEASYGGGAFVYSKSEESPVQIDSCTFTSNVATNKDGKLRGGSALYLIVKVGQIDNCVFSKNKGGNMIKSTEEFDVNLDGLRILQKKENYISTIFVEITKCTFEIQNNETHSLFYFVERQSSESNFINHFVFSILNKVSVSGGMLTSSQNTFSVQFSEEQKREINGEFIKFESDDSLNSSNESSGVVKKSRSLLWFVIPTVVLAALVVAVVTILITKRKRNSECETNEMKENLIDSVTV